MLPVIAAAFGAYFTTAEPCPWPNTCPGTLPKMKQTSVTHWSSRPLTRVGVRVDTHSRVICEGG